MSDDGTIMTVAAVTDVMRSLAARAEAAEAEVARLREALHRISLGSQDSGTTKEALGREARAALEKKP